MRVAGLTVLKPQYALLVVVPLAPGLQYLTKSSALWIFLTGAVAVGVLADWVRRATEQVAERAGPSIGGLLNVSLGSVAEFILALFVLTGDNAEIVRAQITGSILGTCLLGLGLAAVVGGIRNGTQQFNRERAGLLSTMLILVVIALLLPAVFDHTEQAVSDARHRGITDEQLSLSVSVVLLGLYGANLAYTLATRRDAFAPDEPRGQEEQWPLWVSIGVLVLAIAAIALEAELVSDALESTATTLGLSPVFVGVMILALVGTVSDLFAATWFAHQGKMGLVLSICVGSAIQIALVVAPLLVLVSWAIGHPMTLVFTSPLSLFAIVGAAFTVNAVARDGETTWFEGVLLIGVYVLFGLAFFYVV
jgi:Ca2+:H+ antiporter